MRFGTHSGTVYEVEAGRIRRIPRDDNKMRRDGEWVALLTTPYIRVGAPAALLLAPLGEGEATFRTTSEVTWTETP